jgi:pimeloyl-ACP methyl ester carboxylesterase
MTRAFFPALALAALTPVLSASAPAVAAAATFVYTDRISVTVTGQGPDVILIPGLASSAHVWDATVAQLSPHYRLHVVQVAGFADTEPNGNASGPVLEPTLVAIHEYIVANHLQAPAVIGHSLGGLIAMKLAIDHPAEVARLMIVDSLPFAGLMAGPQATVASIEPMAARMRGKLLASTQEEYARTEPASMAKLVKSDGPAAKTAIAAASASDRRVVAQALYDDFTTDLRPDLARIKQPVTMLYPWDAADGASQAAMDSLYQSAFATLPQAKLRRIDGSFHFIMIDQPQAFGLAVDAFLAN